MIKKIDIINGVEVEINNNIITVKGPKGEISRIFKHPFVKIKKEDNCIVVESKNDRRKVRAIVGTWLSHIKNMMIGVKNGWEAKLKLVYSHFPARIKVDKKKVIIENFLGEKNPRVADIVDGVEVKVDKDNILVYGIDKERVGNMALRIEQATKVKKYDRRVFQDGCYIVEKTHEATT